LRDEGEKRRPYSEGMFLGRRHVVKTGGGKSTYESTKTES
jgi:hypothetical protein